MTALQPFSRKFLIGFSVISTTQSYCFPIPGTEDKRQ
jgi:hypothetical protein